MSIIEREVKDLLNELIGKVEETLDGENNSEISLTEENEEENGESVETNEVMDESDDEDMEEDQELTNQTGGSPIKVLRSIVGEAGGRFKGLVSSVTLDLEIPRTMNVEPNGSELFGDEVVRLVHQYAPPSSSQTVQKVGIIFESDELVESVGLSFKNIARLSTQDIVQSLSEISQSNRSPLELDVPMLKMKITYLNPPVGSGGKRRYKMENLLNMITQEKKSRGLIQDEGQVEQEEEAEEEEEEEIETSNRVMRNNVSENCLPHALHQVMMYHQLKIDRSPTNIHKYRASLDKNDNQKRFEFVHKQVQLLKEEAGLASKNKNFDWDDIDSFQKSRPFRGQFQIIVFIQNSYVPYYKGPDVGKGKELYLLLDNDHFRGIRNLPALLGTKYYCKDCETGYRCVSSHYNCKRIHRLCGKEECPKSKDDVEKLCKKCGVNFPSDVCHSNHLIKGINGGKSRCEQTTKCSKCLKSYYSNKNNRIHVCGEGYCHRCQTLKQSNHKCEMMPSIKNEDNLTRKRIFYDIESKADPTTGQQSPVLFIALKCCPWCSNRIPKDLAAARNMSCSKCSPKGNLKVIECISPSNRQVNVQKAMTEWLFSEDHVGFVAVAHNASGFDGQFVLEELVSSTKSAPDLCLEGTKLIFLKHNGLRLLDSMKYWTMSLAAVAKTFEIESVKGDFPIKFITPENFDYHGDIPGNEYYNLDNKSLSLKKQLEQFLDTARKDGKTFNFFDEIQAYCYNDVFILSTAMTNFEESFEVMTDVCLLEETVTAASAAVKVFQRKHLDPLKPIALDAKPSVSMNASVISQKFLAWFDHFEKVNVEMSTTTGEKKIGKYRVDGFVNKCAKYPDGLVIDFRGCYYHAHQCLYSEEAVIGEKRAGEIWEDDEERVRELEKEYPVKIVWECQIKEELKANKEMRDFFEGYQPLDILHCENALVGGRTEVFKLYVNNKGKKFYYLDVVSLYPTVMKHEAWPIGHPIDVPRSEIKTPMKEEQDLKFRGFLSCRVVAPKKLQLPLLPGRVNDRLMFFVCLKCAKQQNQQDCRHTDMERSFNGTFSTAELGKALSVGYVVMEVYHGLQWLEWVENDKDSHEGGLFTSYVNQFMEEKIYSSGWPSNVNTQAEKDEYCRQYMIKEHIKLTDQLKFQKNAGKRAVAKLMLNSLWGKFAQKVDRAQIEIVNHPSRFWSLVHNTKIEMIDVRPVNDVLILKYKERVETLKSLRTGAVHIAALTTSYARLRLYRLMEVVGPENIIYTDTDSIIFTVPDGSKNPLDDQIGTYLGQLTNEVDGEIMEFVTTGPKCYAYSYKDRTGNLKVTRKAKGITINSVVDNELTFELMKTFVDQVLEGVERTSTSFSQFSMQRDRFHRVFSRDIRKEFKYTFNKRRVLSDGSTLPYGYS